ncbi:phage Gp37/Gp68 family protein [Rhizobium sp. CG5]|uniref:phage Gp37/Gp68 family protein n=1 Tax=Rhizobium sp. CG5 TaxID=2726076 RepID=UPI002033919A|nr:phage Gp37/Gp68 family protein [Rhizobium sp. CG5]MCM2472118.1 phage Gp37/Gp68 family protein [Rhizobium sp. CG5]
MADHTKIEWTDATWNPITGCSLVSPGCTNCYAMKLAGTRLKHHPSREGLTKDSKAGPVWTGEVRFNEQWLDQPLLWTKPRMIFVCAHGDLFAEGVTDAWLDQIFAVMALSPRHTFQVLTKRPERMRAYLSNPETVQRVYDLVMDMVVVDGVKAILTTPRTHDVAPAGNKVMLGLWPLPNVWCGVSVEDQKRAVERIPVLLQTPATIRWISAEPLLGLINLTTIDVDNDSFVDALNIRLWGDEIENWQGTEQDWETSFMDWYNLAEMPDPELEILPRLDWVVVGGESGRAAHPMHPDWARSLRDQCAAAGVPFLFKQWGHWREWRDVASGFTNCSRFDRLGNVTEARARLHAPYRNGFQQPEGDFPWQGNFLRFEKSVAGRLLDGVEHNAFPEVR